jgi:hypothetical protein
MSEFHQIFSFWVRCIAIGWEYGDGIFERIDTVTILASGGILFHRKWKKNRDTLEENAMKVAFFIFLASFIISTVIIAPFEQYNATKKQLDAQPDLKAKIAQTEQTIQTQTTTIQLLEAQLSDKGSKLADIEAANDPSAKAIKRRALILCGQLAEFYKEYNSQQEALDLEDFEQENNESQKIRSLPPTNKVERAELEQKFSAIQGQLHLKEQQFEAEGSVKFMDDYYGQIKEIRDELATLGLRDKDLDSHLENPFFTDVYWSQKLAMKVAYLANEIK